MNYPLIILFLSSFFWLFPPFKQYKTDFFYFFLILALSDPLKLGTHYFLYNLHINIYVLSLAFAFLLISSLVSSRKQKYFFIILSILTTVIAFIYSSRSKSVLILLIAAHLIIVFILVFFLIKHIEKNKAINLFLILLVTYEFINVVKLIAGLLSGEQGVISFYMASFAQLFFGISFSFISIKTKDFLLIKTEM